MAAAEVRASTIMKALDEQRVHVAPHCRARRSGCSARRSAKPAAAFSCGEPVANYQLVQAMIADCPTEIFKSMILDPARKRNRASGGDPAGVARQ
ncbi:hypothetical protein [Bradyrhizobium sp. 191]|uniref:hypothetical protein n=1 Tax=Bradyrhizobium sp. 191 TaxID=2782659 RepID=UPI0020002084|nr:hypothetical protein [Bradyrhizobium sp. 191]UPJ66803.1 hypothetical protein IVB23_05380 [Bradyrhizobium sp. 191]